MSYAVKELFMSLQGEGARTGRAAVFIRFSGCNLWNGVEASRSAAVCKFCDTDFVGTNGLGGGRFDSAEKLADAAGRAWTGGARKRYVVLTGGEPLLQVDAALIEALHDECFEVAVETNGTLPVPAGIDWITVSPKFGAELHQVSGSELKVVYPQLGADPAIYENLAFKHFFLQPMDGARLKENTAAAIAFCSQRPQWHLSTQTHKHLGIR